MDEREGRISVVNSAIERTQKARTKQENDKSKQKVNYRIRQ